MNHLTVSSRLEEWWDSSDYSAKLSFAIEVMPIRLAVSAASKTKMASVAKALLDCSAEGGADIYSSMVQYFGELEILHKEIMNGVERRAFWRALLAWQRAGIEKRKKIIARLRSVLPIGLRYTLQIERLHFCSFKELPAGLQLVLEKLVCPQGIAKLVGECFFIIPNIPHWKVLELETMRQSA